MIVAPRKFKKYILVHEKYFALEKSWYDVFRFVVYRNPLFHGGLFFKKKKKLTVLINLKQDLNIIFQDFSATNKTQIRSSVRVGTICQRISNIDEFIDFFNEFAIKKGINTITKDRVLSYGLSNFYAFSAMQNNRIIAVHSYLIDKQASIVMLLTSANIRFDEDQDKQIIIGKANKQLHYFEIQTFKEMGLETFDFGGFATEDQIKNNPGLKGVNAFKLSFGGNVITNYEYCSYPYLLFQFIATKIGIVKSNDSLQN